MNATGSRNNTRVMIDVNFYRWYDFTVTNNAKLFVKDETINMMAHIKGVSGVILMEISLSDRNIKDIKAYEHHRCNKVKDCHIKAVREYLEGKTFQRFLFKKLAAAQLV